MNSTGKPPLLFVQETIDLPRKGNDERFLINPRSEKAARVEAAYINLGKPCSNFEHGLSIKKYNNCFLCIRSTV